MKITFLLLILTQFSYAQNTIYECGNSTMNHYPNYFGLRHYGSNHYMAHTLNSDYSDLLRVFPDTLGTSTLVYWITIPDLEYYQNVDFKFEMGGNINFSTTIQVT